MSDASEEPAPIEQMTIYEALFEEIAPTGATCPCGLCGVPTRWVDAPPVLVMGATVYACYACRTERGLLTRNKRMRAQQGLPTSPLRS